MSLEVILATDKAALSSSVSWVVHHKYQDQICTMCILCTLWYYCSLYYVCKNNNLFTTFNVPLVVDVRYVYLLPVVYHYKTFTLPLCMHVCVISIVLPFPLPSHVMVYVYFSLQIPRARFYLKWSTFTVSK